MHAIKIKTRQKQSSTPALRASHRSKAPIQAHAKTNSAEIRNILQAPQVQSKLKVNQPNDQYELEADKVADEVMRMPENPNHNLGFNEDDPLQRQPENEEEELQWQPDNEIEDEVQRMSDGPEEKDLQRASEDEDESEDELMRQDDEEDEMVQAKGDSGSEQLPVVTAGIESQIRSQKSSGQPLSTSSKEYLEPRFGRDLSHVRVHTDNNAAGTAKQINAKAFTWGRHVFFGSGHYQPNTRSGKRLLAHELTHVFQQKTRTSGRTSDDAVQRQGVIMRQATAAPAPVQNRATSSQSVAEWILLSQQSDPSDSSGQVRRRLTILNQTDRVSVLQEVERRMTTAQWAQLEQVIAQAIGQSGAPGGEVLVQSTTTLPVVDSSGGSNSSATSHSTSQAIETDTTADNIDLSRPASDIAQESSTGAQSASEPADDEAAVITSPDQDPGFQGVVQNISSAASQQRSHPSAASRAQEAQSAALSPQSEVEGRAQSTQVGTMEQAETPPFDAASFRARLIERIESLTPQTTQEADNFSEDNALAPLSNEMQRNVAEQTDNTQSSLRDRAQETPDTSNVEPRAVTPLSEVNAGPAPPDLGAQNATPRQRSQSEIEGPLQQSSQSVEQQMVEANITDAQLQNSNEPEFQGALSSRQELQSHSAEAPQEFRQNEQEQLTTAQTNAIAAAQQQSGAMHASRADLLNQVGDQQNATKSKDEQAREKVGNDINQIYETTKTDVEAILTDLDQSVSQKFTEGAAEAKRSFEKDVERQIGDFKDRRYGNWLGWARWAKDKLLGMPPEVNAFYQIARDQFVSNMNQLIDSVIRIIGDALTRAKARATQGKQQIRNYINELPENLKSVGEQAASNIQDRFASLEESINEKQGDLIDTLASQYNETVQSVDARIDEMKAANQGLADKAMNAVAGVIKTITELKNMMLTLLAKVADTINVIIADPIKFISNFFSGVKLGFQNFVGNIVTHLQTGLIGWLTGSLGPVGIQIPENLFSLKGIFSLVMQVLGLTWDKIRAKAVKLLGEPVVNVLETSFTIFKIIIRDGVSGLWEFVKEKFTDLKEMVIEQIKSMVITEVVKAGVKWILGLLNPASAFVKAVMTIIDVVKFFVERGRQILELVNAIVDSIAAVAQGNVSAVAQKVETALSRALPVLIGFLASLLGLSGLVDKVQKIIRKIQSRIDKAIDSVILKAKKAARKLFKGGKRRKKADKKASSNEVIANDAVEALQKPSSKSTIAEIVEEKSKLARKLEKNSRSKLDKNQRMIITTDNKAKTEQDLKLDFEVKITSNDTVKKGSAPVEDEHNIPKLIEVIDKNGNVLISKYDHQAQNGKFNEGNLLDGRKKDLFASYKPETTKGKKSIDGLTAEVNYNIHNTNDQFPYKGNQFQLQDKKDPDIDGENYKNLRKDFPTKRRSYFRGDFSTLLPALKRLADEGKIKIHHESKWKVGLAQLADSSFASMDEDEKNKIQSEWLESWAPGTHVHHIHPLNFGGDNSKTNFIPLRAGAHTKRGGIHPEFWTPLGNFLKAVKKKIKAMKSAGSKRKS